MKSLNSQMTKKLHLLRRNLILAQATFSKVLCHISKNMNTKPLCNISFKVVAAQQMWIWEEYVSGKCNNSKKNSLHFLHKRYNSKIIIMQIIQYYLFRRMIFIYHIQCILCDWMSHKQAAMLIVELGFYVIPQNVTNMINRFRWLWQSFLSDIRKLNEVEVKLVISCMRTWSVVITVFFCCLSFRYLACYTTWK